MFLMFWKFEKKNDFWWYSLIRSRSSRPYNHHVLFSKYNFTETIQFLLVEFNTESKRKVIRWSWIEHFGKIAQKQVQTKPFLRWRPCRRHIVVLQCHHHNFLVKHPSNYRHRAQDLPNNQVVARWNLLKYDKLFRMIIVITW